MGQVTGLNTVGSKSFDQVTGLNTVGSNSFDQVTGLNIVGSNLFDLLRLVAARQQNLADTVKGNTEPSVHQGEQFAAIAVNEFTLVTE